MITKVGNVTLFVADQDRAKAFYSEVVGFEVRRDEPIFPGSTARWIAVAPKGAETEIILYLADMAWEHYSQVVGKMQALTLSVPSIHAVYDTLKAKGVAFTQEIEEQPWGTFTMMIDSEGNQILLVQES